MKLQEPTDDYTKFNSPSNKSVEIQSSQDDKVRIYTVNVNHDNNFSLKQVEGTKKIIL